MFVPSTKKPPVWMLIGVTYGVCAALTIAAAVVYFRSSTGGQPVAGEMDKAGPIAVGSLWLASYPGAMVVGHTTSHDGDVTRSTLTLKTSDPADRILMFYEGKLKGGRFRVDFFTKSAGGGTIKARLRNGKARVEVVVESVPNGAEAKITAIEN